MYAHDTASLSHKTTVYVALSVPEETSMTKKVTMVGKNNVSLCLHDATPRDYIESNLIQ